jgi:short-subunit dehydrogenase
VPLMLSQEHEVHIVNMASFTGLISTPGLAIYGSSKHALVRISEALIISSSRSSDHRCACRVICPEGVQTRLASARRNRPARLRRGSEDEFGPDEQTELERAFRARAGDNTMAPNEVADQILDAIRREQFYVLPHENTDAIRRRMRSILQRRNPEPHSAG